MPHKTTESYMWRSGIVIAAALQRFGHYGMRSLLIVYLTRGMKMSGQEAGQIYGLFYGSFFFTSLIGGTLGDSRLGYSWIGAIGLTCMVAGHIGLYAGGHFVTMCVLALYTIGFGLFDPNLSVAVARKHHDARSRDAAYTVLYTSINIGAMLGPLLFGFIAIRTDARLSFLLGGLWPLIALFTFRSATRDGSLSSSTGGTEETLRDNRVQHSTERGWRLSRRRTMTLVLLGLAGIVFAAVFDQLGSSVTLLTQEHVSRDVGSFKLPAGYVQSINPLFVIILGPLFALAAKHLQSSGQTLGRVGVLSLGILLVGSGFGVLALASSGISHHVTVKWVWIIVSIFLATVGELLFAPLALSLVASLSPPGRQSFLLGAWSATYGIGAYLSGTMAGLMNRFGAFSLFFGISAAACWVTGLLLWVAGRAVNTAALEVA